MQTKMNLPKCPFFKNSLNGANEQVLMSVPAIDNSACLHNRDWIHSSNTLITTAYFPHLGLSLALSFNQLTHAY